MDVLDHPHDHPELGYQLAQYLAVIGVCHDPDADQEATRGDVPAVFLQRFYDAPDRAICIVSGEVDHDQTSDSNPAAFFTVIFRGAPDDQIAPAEDAVAVFEALHDQLDVQLTAEQRMLVCRRTATGSLLFDQNGRFYRADTYRAVMAVPTT